jgi:hypothetical protein
MQEKKHDFLDTYSGGSYTKLQAGNASKTHNQIQKRPPL